MNTFAYKLFALFSDLASLKRKDLVLNSFINGVNTISSCFRITGFSPSRYFDEYCLEIRVGDKSGGYFNLMRIKEDFDVEFDILQGSMSLLGNIFENLDREKQYNNETRRLRTVIDSQIFTPSDNDDRFRQLVDNLDEVVWIREESAFTFISKGYERIWGRPCSEIYANPNSFFDHLHPDDRETLKDVMLSDDFSHNGYLNEEFRIVKPDGEIRWIWGRSFPIYKSDVLVRQVGVGMDVTARKAIEFAKPDKKYNNNVEEKVQNDFLANVSHELRTPLNGIIGFSNMLSLRDDLTDESGDFVELIKSSALQLHSLVENLLRFASLKNEENSMILSDFNLSELCEELVNSFKIKALNKNIDFVYSFKSTGSNNIVSCKSYIGQILINLFENALNFTNSGSIVFDVQISDNVVLTVRDTGIGIDENDLDKVFIPLYPIRNLSHGAGLGLSVVERIVNTLRGHIEVKSQQGIGTTFIVSLPINIEDKLKNDSKPDMNRALLVEDDNLQLLYLKKIFSDLNISYDVALNGLQAIEKYKQTQYAFVLMDMSLPVMNGIDAIKKIREYEKTSGFSCTIIAVSSYTFEEGKDKVLKAGANKFVSKPVPESIIIGLIKEYAPALLTK